MDGLQAAFLCPQLSLPSLAMPMCLRVGWTPGPATPGLMQDGGVAGGPGQRQACPPPLQQQCRILGQAPPARGYQALTPEAHHQPVQI